MADITQEIDVNEGDKFHVAVSAYIQSFRYHIVLYLPDGAGGTQPPQVIGAGDNAHSQWIGTGAQIRDGFVTIGVAQGGQTPTSLYEIDVRLVIERGTGVFEDLYTWRIAPGLASGVYTSLTLKFK